MKHSIGPRISPTTRECLETIWGNTNRGAQYVLDMFNAQYRAAIVSMMGTFTAGELSLLLEVYNGTLITPEIAGQTIIGEVSDAIALDGVDRKWEVDKGALLEKLGKLTRFQAAVLEIWAWRFWHVALPSGEITLDVYVSSLTE